MNRRRFLQGSIFIGTSLAFEKLWAKQPRPTENRDTFSTKVQVIDAHAHPDRYRHPGSTTDPSSSVNAIQGLGMAGSSFSAVGDTVYVSRGRMPGKEYDSAKTQLGWWLNGVIKTGKVKLVFKSSDIPETGSPEHLPGGFLAIEGGDPLQGKPERVDEFYEMGVRMITLVHYRNNEIGDIMKPWRNLSPGPSHGGLTPAGRKIVKWMEEVGMIIDVAHADSNTLKQIAEMSSKPLVDSHTNLCSLKDGTQCGRLRRWEEMEVVARTGGVVCTWPLAYQGKQEVRMTFLDWAREILEMKRHIGMEHVGLGTDGGGHLIRRVNGYRDVRDLPKLMKAMEEIGFPADEIAAYMGGNFLRVLRTCIG